MIWGWTTWRTWWFDSALHAVVPERTSDTQVKQASNLRQVGGCYGNWIVLYQACVLRLKLKCRDFQPDRKLSQKVKRLQSAAASVRNLWRALDLQVVEGNADSDWSLFRPAEGAVVQLTAGWWQFSSEGLSYFYLFTIFKLNFWD